MPIRIDKVEVDTAMPESPALVVHYRRPGEPTMPHTHLIPLRAVVMRYAVLGLEAMEDAIEEIIYEALSAPDRNPHRFPGKADRVGAKSKHGNITGLAKALRDADIETLVSPPDEVVVDVQTHFLRTVGREHFARTRGVPIEEIPDLPGPVTVGTPGDQPDGKRHGRLAVKMPSIARDRPVHVRAPK